MCVGKFLYMPLSLESLCLEVFPFAFPVCFFFCLQMFGMGFVCFCFGGKFPCYGAAATAIGEVGIVCTDRVYSSFFLCAVVCVYSGLLAARSLTHFTT